MPTPALEQSASTPETVPPVELAAEVVATPPVTPPAPTAKIVPPDPVREQLEEMRRQLFDDAPVAVEPETTPEPQVEPETTPETVTHETAEAVAAVVAPVAKDPDALPDGIERPRLQDPQDQVIAALKKSNPALSWAECEARVKGPSATQVAAETTTTEDPIAAELAEIDAALTADAEAGNLPTLETRKLHRREAELLAEQRAQALVRPIQEKENARVAQTFEAARSASREQAMKDFPDGYKDGTPLNAEFHQMCKEMQDPSSPHYLPDFTAKANAPEIALGRAAIVRAEKDASENGVSFAEALAALKGKLISAQAQAVQTPPPTAAPVTPARKPAVTAPGNLGTRTPDRAITQEESDAKLRAEKDPAKIHAMIFGANAQSDVLVRA